MTGDDFRKAVLTELYAGRGEDELSQLPAVTMDPLSMLAARCMVVTVGKVTGSVDDLVKIPGADIGYYRTKSMVVPLDFDPRQVARAILALHEQ